MAKKAVKQEPTLQQQILAALGEEQLAEARDLLADQHPADIARLLESIPPNQRLVVWKLIPFETIGDTLIELSEGVRRDLLTEMSVDELVTAARTLDTDDIADLIPELPDEVIAEILYAMDNQDRQRLDTVLSFPEDTAGGLMNVDTITVRENVTLEVVLRYLRRRGELPEHTSHLWVVNREDMLIGALSVSKLLTSDPQMRVSQVMERDIESFNAMTPAKAVAAAFERYDLVTAPVVDEHGRLLGRITVDDVVDVIREEADREILHLAGLKGEEDLFASVWDSVKNRWKWFAVNLVTAFIASRVIGMFEGSIERLVALAALMPIVAGIGGNSGNQTITMIVRGLALNQIHMTHARKLFAKEIGVSVINGVMWGTLLGLAAYLLYRNIPLGLVMAAAMTLNLILASLAGVAIPLIRYQRGRDPAIGSSVMITAITDSGGFFIFLGLATLFLL